MDLVVPRSELEHLIRLLHITFQLHKVDCKRLSLQNHSYHMTIHLICPLDYIMIESYF